MSWVKDIADFVGLLFLFTDLHEMEFVIGGVYAIFCNFHDGGWVLKFFLIGEMVFPFFKREDLGLFRGSFLFYAVSFFLSFLFIMDFCIYLAFCEESEGGVAGGCLLGVFICFLDLGWVGGGRNLSLRLLSFIFLRRQRDFLYIVVR